MHGIEKELPQNFEHMDVPAQAPNEHLQSGLDAAAELAVDLVTAPVGLGTYEVPETEAPNGSPVSMSTEVVTTSNGYEIEHPREKLDVHELQTMLGEYNLGGETPQDRVEALKNQSKENFALFLTDLNRRLQGSDDTLVHDDTMKIGDKETIAPEDRYDLFTSIYEKVQGADQAVNPARVGDALALATVMLHPFKDGNGRTARTLGYLYRADFNDAGDVQEFGQVIEPRDEARKRGGYMINGYVPYMEEGSSQSDPAQVGAFIDRILQDDTSRLYTSPYGQAPIHAENSSTEVAG